MTQYHYNYNVTKSHIIVIIKMTLVFFKGGEGKHNRYTKMRNQKNMMLPIRSTGTPQKINTN